MELDEAYVGGRRSGGKRGRAAPGKTIVMGLAERDGAVRAVVIPDVKKATFAVWCWTTWSPARLCRPTSWSPTAYSRMTATVARGEGADHRRELRGRRNGVRRGPAAPTDADAARGLSRAASSQRIPKTYAKRGTAAAGQHASGPFWSRRRVATRPYGDWCTNLHTGRYNRKIQRAPRRTCQLMPNRSRRQSSGRAASLGHDLSLRAFQFGEDVQQCADMKSLSWVTQEAILTVGMTAVASGIVSGPRRAEGQMFHFVNWPEDWLALYLSHGYVDKDPVPRWAAHWASYP